ncbi:MAG: hypothetical protein HY079_07450, partial [Elusimicrobia bacterium]|nr:hypothetical protein [Elusimicrobiota bacterium]
KDLVEAYRWTLTASRHPVASVFDDPRAGLSNAWSETERAQTRDELQQLEKTMTRAQVAEAARRATPAK